MDSQVRDERDSLLIARVNAWAREYDASSFNYGSRYSYWRSARWSDVITEEEFERGAVIYGNLWHYRGD